MSAARRLLVAGNWKMNHGGLSGLELVRDIVQGLRDGSASGVDVLVAPPFTAIAAAASEAEGTALLVAGQNLDDHESGAFTGEIAGSMLIESGATWVLVGHSERRRLFGETDAVVAAKTSAALKAGLHPIVCVGETLEERDAGKTLEVIVRQTRAVLALLGQTPGFAVLAYEPVWAIGTGRTATPAQAEEAHAALRKLLTEEGVSGLADVTRILYGGSVTPDNAAELFQSPNVDGGLIGGASLRAGSFLAMVRAAAELTRSAGTS
jgi:triosephosphate isomerase